MKKTLVLIRHAHRDNTIRSRDNGLSEKGKEQAKWVKKYFFERFDDADSIWLVSSPKKRCLETIAPIADQAGLEIDINPDLAEQSDSETAQKFQDRVNRFLREWTQMPQPLTVVSSHGDWLPVAVFHLLGCQCDFRKGGWLEIEWDGMAVLKCYIQSFKSFYG